MNIPKGWKLVPVEPTLEMAKAGGHVNSEWLNDAAPLFESRYTLPIPGVWEKMLDAAPTPPAQQDDAALEVLRELMLWIENWGCAFHDDPEWPETDAKVRVLLTKRGAA